MDLNKVITVFNAAGVNSIRKQDLTDATKKNDATVKSIKNIFDTNLDGILDDSELALIDKLSALAGNNSEISITELKYLAALNGSGNDISFGDLSLLKNNKYSTENNSISSYDLNQRKTSTTTFNADGTITKTAYAYNNTQTVTEYTSDYKMITKTVIKSDGTQEISTYNDAGIVIKKDEIAKDGSKTSTEYNSDGKTSVVTKTDANNGFVSKEEYDYADNGSVASITAYGVDGNEIAKTIWTEDKTKIQVKYDSNGEIIQRDTFNRLSKPVSSFIKNDDGSTVSTEYDYLTNGDTRITEKTYAADGSQQKEQVTTKSLKGCQEVYTNGVLTQKDEVDAYGTVKSTVYSAENVVDNVTFTDKNGNITKIDYYTYLNGNIDTITEKDTNGNLLGYGKYNYDNPSEIKSLDHFDASGKLIDKAIWNLDGTNTVLNYDADGQINLTENYGTDGRITSSIKNTEDGGTETSTYTYNTGSTTVITTNRDNANTVTSYKVSVIDRNGSSETNIYNDESKTLLLENTVVDRYGAKVVTVYEDGKITSVTKTNNTGGITGKDNYNYTDGVLTSVDHLNLYGRPLGKTEYDQDGNSKDYDSLGRIISAKTTNPATGVVTTETYQYLSSGDKIIKITEALNGKTQSLVTKIVHVNNSSEVSTYSGPSLKLAQKDNIDKNGNIKTTIYDTANNRITSVVNKNTAGNIQARNMYYYNTKGTLDYMNCFNGNDNLTQYIKYTSDGGKIVTCYDNNGNVQDITTYDKDGNVIATE